MPSLVRNAQGFTRPGRLQLTLDEFVLHYGPSTDFCGSEQRLKIWEQFAKVTQKLRDTLPVAAVWIGGSFVTHKVEPSDIDAVYIIDQNKYSILSETGKKRVTLYAMDGGLFNHGIRVDSHVLDWTPHPELDWDNPLQIDYLKSRGYWDDFLQRHAEDKNAPLIEDNAIPRRGYLEVILDGYDA